MRKELVTHLDPKSPVSETFRTLSTNIQFMNSNRRLRSLLLHLQCQEKAKVGLLQI